MKTFASLAQWCAGATVELGDPAEAVCQAFFRWQDHLQPDGQDLVCGMQGDQVVICLTPHVALPVAVQTGEPRLNEGGDALEAFAIDQVVPGMWSLRPSLNIPGLIHAFVVLYGVPDPAPWERRIVVASRIEAVAP